MRLFFLRDYGRVLSRSGIGAALWLAVPVAAQPALVTFGGLGEDQGYDVAVDSHGHTVVTGSFEGTVVFNSGNPTVSRTSVGGTDAFVAFYQDDGALMSLVTLGSEGEDRSWGVGLDAEGYAYVVGTFSGTVDFDPGEGTAIRTSAGGTDVFVARYHEAGGLLSVVTFGSAGNDGGLSVGADASGNSVVTGFFEGTVDFDPGEGTVNRTSAGRRDVFVARFAPFYGTLVSVATFGGIGDDNGYGVAVDAAGNAIVTGTFYDTVDFDPGAGTARRTEMGNGDVFVARYTLGGSFLSVATFGGAIFDTGADVAVDANGNAVVAGSFYATVDFDPREGTKSRSAVGSRDVFVARYDAAGAFVSVFTFGGAGEDTGGEVAIDADGSVVVTGSFASTSVDFDPSEGTAIRTSTNLAGFVARYDAAGAFVSVATIDSGGDGGSGGSGVALDANGNSVVTGGFLGTVDFDPGVGVEPRTSVGEVDAFVARYTSDGVLATAPVYTGVDEVLSREVAIQVSDVRPNPTRGRSQARIAVAVPQRVSVGVYDVLGRRVVEVFEGVLAPGAAETVSVELSALPVGVYVVRVEGERSAVTRTLVVMR